MRSFYTRPQCSPVVRVLAVVRLVANAAIALARLRQRDLPSLNSLNRFRLERSGQADFLGNDQQRMAHCAAARIEGRRSGNVLKFPTFSPRSTAKKA